MVRRPRVVGSLGLFVVFTSLFAGCLASETRPFEPAPSAGASVPAGGASLQHLNWSMPYDGDLAVALRLESAEAARCDWAWTAWGVATDLGPTMGRFVEGAEEGPRYDVGGGSTSLEASVRVHAADVVDQELVPVRYGWLELGNRTYTLVPGQALNITWFAIGLQAGDPDGLRTPHAREELGDDDSIRLVLACNSEVHLAGLEVGYDVVVFNEATLRGGAGAHFYVLSDPTGATIASTVSKELASEQGVLFVEVYGDLLLNHVGAGIIDMTYPGGSDRLIDYPMHMIAGCATGLACPDAHRLYREGPGTYSVTATYASVDVTSMLRGAIVGLNQVQEFPG